MRRSVCCRRRRWRCPGAVAVAGGVAVEDAEELGECAEDVPERVAVVDGDVAQEEVVHARAVGAAARVQAQRLRHLQHRLEELGAGRVRRHGDAPHRLLRRDEWTGSGGVLGGGGVDDGVGAAGGREGEAAGRDGGGQAADVGLRVGVVVVEEGRGGGGGGGGRRDGDGGGGGAVVVGKVKEGRRR
uniref:Uncharacterized protein n=1 Tax=Triticum urartu TaxID=4572 RepID=A0A8R7U9D4_TRIUA